MFPLVFAFGWSIDLFMPATPFFLKAFKLNENWVDVIVCLFFILLGVTQLACIFLLEYINRFKLAMFAALLFCFASIFCAFSGSVMQFICAYSLLSISAGMTSIAGITIIKRDFYQRQSVKVYSLVNSFGAFSNLAGSILSVSILATLSWRFVFIILFLFGCFILFCSYKSLHKRQITVSHERQLFSVRREKIGVQLAFFAKHKRFYYYACLAIVANCAYLAMAMVIPVVLMKFNMGLIKLSVLLFMLAIAFWLGSILVVLLTRYVKNSYCLLQYGSIVMSIIFFCLFLYAGYAKFNYYYFAIFGFMGIISVSFLIGPSIGGAMDYFKCVLDSSAGVIMALIFISTGLINLTLSLLPHITVEAVSLYIVITIMLIQLAFFLSKCVCKYKLGAQAK
ncbi:MFS transporter [Facilibium subflavum]|uniref:MFS transporter n=1 Tax=Facilibium subflavum TaxID=2219058 RepID=UPI0013C329AD|nr:MFS transporter [Facilibium subflavum]